jgi:hypothetical protein
MSLAAATGELGQKARAISFRSSEVYRRIAVDTTGATYHIYRLDSGAFSKSIFPVRVTMSCRAALPIDYRVRAPPLHFSISRPVHRGIGLSHVSPSAEVGTSFDQSAYSISRPVHQRLYCSSHQSAYPGLYSIILFVDPSIYGDLCCFLISRPVRRSLSTWHSIDLSIRPVLLFVASGPSVDDSFCALYQSAPPWRLCTAPSISQLARGDFLYTFYPSAPP